MPKHLDTPEASKLSLEEKTHFMAVLNQGHYQEMIGSVQFDRVRNPQMVSAIRCMTDKQIRHYRDAWAVGKLIAYQNNSNALSPMRFQQCGHSTKAFLMNSENQQYLRLGLDYLNKAQRTVDRTRAIVDFDATVINLTPWQQLQFSSAMISTMSDRKENLALMQKFWGIGMEIVPAGKAGKYLKIGGITFNPFDPDKAHTSINVIKDLPLVVFQRGSVYESEVNTIYEKSPEHIQLAIDSRRNEAETKLVSNKLEQLKHRNASESKALQKLFERGCVKNQVRLNQIYELATSTDMKVDMLYEYMDVCYQELVKIQTEKNTERAQAQAMANFQGLIDGYNLLSQIGAQFGNKTLQRFGTIGVSVTQGIFGFAQLTGKLGMTATTGLASLTPFTMIATSILSIVNCISRNHEPDQLQQSLSTILNGINAMHRDMCQGFGMILDAQRATQQLIQQTFNHLNAHLYSQSERLNGIENQLTSIDGRLKELTNEVVCQEVKRRRDKIQKVHDFFERVTDDCVDENLLEYLQGINNELNEIRHGNCVNVDMQTAFSGWFKLSSLHASLDNAQFHEFEVNIDSVSNYAFWHSLLYSYLRKQALIMRKIQQCNNQGSKNLYRKLLDDIDLKIRTNLSATIKLITTLSSEAFLTQFCDFYTQQLQTSFTEFNQQITASENHARNHQDHYHVCVNIDLLQKRRVAYNKIRRDFLGQLTVIYSLLGHSHHELLDYYKSQWKEIPENLVDQCSAYHQIHAQTNFVRAQMGSVVSEANQPDPQQLIAQLVNPINSPASNLLAQLSEYDEITALMSKMHSQLYLSLRQSRNLSNTTTKETNMTKTQHPDQQINEAELTISQLQEVTQVAQQARDKVIVPVLGDTGDGKSTLLDYLRGDNFVSEIDEELGNRVAVHADPAKAGAVGHQINESHTIIPRVVQPSPAVNSSTQYRYTYVDFQGFHESRKGRKFISSYSPELIKNESSKVNGIVLVVKGQNLVNGRQSTLKSMLTYLANIAKYKPKTLIKSLIIVVNRTEMNIRQIYRSLQLAMEALDKKEKLFWGDFMKFNVRNQNGEYCSDEEVLKNIPFKIFVSNVLDEGESREQLNKLVASLSQKDKELFDFTQYAGEQKALYDQLDHVMTHYVDHKKLCAEQQDVVTAKRCLAINVSTTLQEARQKNEQLENEGVQLQNRINLQDALIVQTNNELQPFTDALAANNGVIGLLPVGHAKAQTVDNWVKSNRDFGHLVRRKNQTGLDEVNALPRIRNARWVWNGTYRHHDKQYKIVAEELVTSPASGHNTLTLTYRSRIPCMALNNITGWTISSTYDNSSEVCTISVTYPIAWGLSNQNITIQVDTNACQAKMTPMQTQLAEHQAALAVLQKDLANNNSSKMASATTIGKLEESLRNAHEKFDEANAAFQASQSELTVLTQQATPIFKLVKALNIESDAKRAIKAREFISAYTGQPMSVVDDNFAKASSVTANDESISTTSSATNFSPIVNMPSGVPQQPAFSPPPQVVNNIVVERVIVDPEYMYIDDDILKLQRIAVINELGGYQVNLMASEPGHQPCDYLLKNKFEDNRVTMANKEVYVALLPPTEHTTDVEGNKSGVSRYLDKTLHQDTKDAFDELMPVLLNEDKCAAKIVFACRVNTNHWVQYEILIEKQNNQYQCAIAVHDPRGHGAADERSYTMLISAVTTRITDEHNKYADNEKNNRAEVVFHESANSPYDVRRQHELDGTSCGVFVVDELVARIQDKNLDELGSLPIGAETLRQAHIEKVAEFYGRDHADCRAFLRRVGFVNGQQVHGQTHRQAVPNNVAYPGRLFGRYQQQGVDALHDQPTQLRVGSPTL